MSKKLSYDNFFMTNGNCITDGNRKFILDLRAQISF